MLLFGRGYIPDDFSAGVQPQRNRNVKQTKLISFPTLSNQARRKTDLSPRILSTVGLMKMTELMALSRASFLSSPFSRHSSETHVLSESEVNEKYAFAPCSMSVATNINRIFGKDITAW